MRYVSTFSGVEAATDRHAVAFAANQRYKALGNSMAVPVMRWIGERIAAVEDESKR